MKSDTNSNTTLVLIKMGTFSLALALASIFVVAPPKGAMAQIEGAQTAAERPVEVQRFTAPATVKPVELDRAGYSVASISEEKRLAELATPASLASTLIVTKESFVLHDKNDGTVIFPVTTWRFEPGSSGYHTSERPEHNGVDFPIGEGTNIYSVADGEVIKVDYDPAGYGNYAMVKHSIGGHEVISLYGHMVEAPDVSVGDQVKKGTVLGHVGSTGRSTGNHLHFEVTVDGESQDPASWLELNAIR